MAQVLPLKIDSDGVPVQTDPTSDEVTYISGQFGNVKASGNSVISTDTNGNLTLTPDGTGDLVLDGVNWPQADGSSGQHLTTDGAGQSAWTTPAPATNANTVCNDYTADEAFDVGNPQVAYISAASNVSKCDSSGAGIASRAMGFNSSGAVIDTGTVSICSEGLLAGFTGLAAGSRYFADPSTAGGITTTRPVGTGNTIVQVGYAASTTEMQIHIEQMGRIG